VAGIPHAVIIDHQGKIVWQGHPMDNLAKQLDSVLEKMPKELREKLQATESQSVIKTANPVEPK
jgi:hypothetical protein